MEMASENIDENEFLDTIYDLDNRLNMVFFQGTSRELLPQDIIYKGLNSSSDFVRDTYAKTLLVHVFMHPDRLRCPVGLSQKILYLIPNYGQTACWLHHLTPDNEFTHIFTAEEYAAAGHASFRKSFWVLKQGFTYVDFYKTLLLRLKFG